MRYRGEGNFIFLMSKAFNGISILQNFIEARPDTSLVTKTRHRTETAEDKEDGKWIVVWLGESMYMAWAWYKKLDP